MANVRVSVVTLASACLILAVGRIRSCRTELPDLFDVLEDEPARVAADHRWSQ